MWRRVAALLLRYFYIHQRSIPRIMEIVFWPVMGLLVWGFLVRYMERVAVPGAVTFLVGSVILWEALYRAQQSISLSITEEYWVRNILNLFISPLRVRELVLAACLTGLIKCSVVTVFLSILAYAAYAFDLRLLGPALIPFYGNLLLFGWAVGLGTMALIFRFGRAAEGLIWGVPFLLQPLSAVFYPVDVLPAWLKPVSLALPSTYVFEGMRAALSGGSVDLGLLARCFLLNLVWLAAGAAFFGLTLRRVKELGYLARQIME